MLPHKRPIATPYQPAAVAYPVCIFNVNTKQSPSLTVIHHILRFFMRNSSSCWHDAHRLHPGTFMRRLSGITSSQSTQRSADTALWSILCMLSAASLCKSSSTDALSMMSAISCSPALFCGTSCSGNACFPTRNWVAIACEQQWRYFCKVPRPN